MSNGLVVKGIDFLIFSKSIIEQVHDYACVIHHVQSIECGSDTALAPIVLNDLNTAHSPLHHSHESFVLFHYLVYDF